MIILEENFKWHLEAFASELMFYRFNYSKNVCCCKTIFVKLSGFFFASMSAQTWRRLQSTQKVHGITQTIWFFIIEAIYW